MKRNKIKTYLILLVSVVNLFNVFFVLVNLRGKENYLNKILSAVKSYIVGFHSIPFILVFVFLFAVFLLRRQSTSQFLRNILFVFLIFCSAINMARFPLANYSSYGEANPLLDLKKNSTLSETLDLSPSREARGIRSYIEMNKSLQGKILVLPFPIETRDNYFRALVKPLDMLEKHYEFELGEEEYKRLKEYPNKVFKVYKHKKHLQKYILIILDQQPAKLQLFAYDKEFILVPVELVDRILP